MGWTPGLPAACRADMTALTLLMFASLNSSFTVYVTFTIFIVYCSLSLSAETAGSVSQSHSQRKSTSSSHSYKAHARQSKANCVSETRFCNHGCEVAVPEAHSDTSTALVTLFVQSGTTACVRVAVYNDASCMHAHTHVGGNGYYHNLHAIITRCVTRLRACDIYIMGLVA